MKMIVWPLGAYRTTQQDKVELDGGPTMRCSERRRAVAVAIGAPRSRRR